MSLLLRKNNPQRPVDWRWQRARELADSRERLVRARDDIYIARARKFAKVLNRCRNERQRWALYDAEPNMYEAWELYDEEASPDTGPKWELEARILAGEEIGTVAKKTCIPVEAIKMYEALFFNVMDRLASPGYITHQVFGSSAQRGLNERSYDLIWKMFGYWMGPLAVDLFAYKWSGMERPSNPGQLNAVLSDDMKSQLMAKAVLAIRTVPVNWQTQLEIVNTYLRQNEIEQGVGGAGTQDTFMNNMQVFMQKVSWTIHEQMRAPATILDKLDAGPISVRAHEMLQTTQGQMSQSIIHATETAVFPEESHGESKPPIAGTRKADLQGAEHSS